MAIDLPPVIPAQESSIQRLEAYIPANKAIIKANLQGIDVEVTGNRFLRTDQIQAIIAASNTPDIAVKALSLAYYQLGYLLETVYYAKGNGRLLIHVVNGQLANVDAPESIEPHFHKLAGDTDLTIAELDKSRVLADVKSRRMGKDFRISYKLDGDPEKYTLVVRGEDAKDHDAGSFSFNIGNPGNRFLGRYFAGLGYQQDFKNGTQASINYDGVLVDLGEAESGKNYHSLRFKTSHPFSFGLYTLELSHLQYEREIEDGLTVNAGDALELLGIVILPGTTETVDVTIDADTQSASFLGEQVLASDRNSRLTTSQRIRWVDSLIELPDFDQDILLEETTSLELGVKYSKSYRNKSNKGRRLSSQLLVEKGFSSNRGTFDTAVEDGTVGIAARQADFLVIKPKFAGNFGLFGRHSLNFDFIGQYSAEGQVPQHFQFVMGGLNTMSAFLPGVLVGDTGAFARLAWQWQPEGWGFLGSDKKLSLFVESAASRYEDASGDFEEFGDTISASDAGIRFSSKLFGVLDSEMVFAEPIDDDGLEKVGLNAEELEVDFFWRLRKRF